MQRLQYWAQNEEMVDQYYTDHGCDCMTVVTLFQRIKEECEGRLNSKRDYNTGVDEAWFDGVLFLAEEILAIIKLYEEKP